jgi:hypothetical protein
MKRRRRRLMTTRMTAWMNGPEKAWLIAISDSISNWITSQTFSGILSNMIAPLSSLDHIVQTLVDNGNNESLSGIEIMVE